MNGTLDRAKLAVTLSVVTGLSMVFSFARCKLSLRPAAPPTPGPWNPPLESAKPVPESQWRLDAALAAWVVPGLGHYLLGEGRRAAILFVCIMIPWIWGFLL